MKNFYSIIFNRKFQNIFLIFFFIFSIALFVLAFTGGDSYDIFKISVQKNIFYGILVFVFLEVSSIIIAPVTTIFLIPVASQIFGPFLTAILSLFGWVIGSVIAFLLARRFGRPFLEKIVDPKKLEKYRNYISSDAEFLTVILLRIIMPVDILSYAVGLFTVMRFKKYLLATIIGITPFAFIYSYGGEAFLNGNYAETIYIAIGAVIFIMVMIIFLKILNKKNK